MNRMLDMIRATRHWVFQSRDREGAEASRHVGTEARRHVVQQQDWDGAVEAISKSRSLLRISSGANWLLVVAVVFVCVVRVSDGLRANEPVEASPQTSGPPDVYSVRSSAITAGGARGEGGDFASNSSSGQPAAGVMTGGDFSMTGGIVAAVSCGGCQLYGDVQPSFGNCDVNLDDILCVLTGFAQASTCSASDVAPCGGNNIINLDDILAILAAFGGNFLCPHPCPQ